MWHALPLVLGQSRKNVSLDFRHCERCTYTQGMTEELHRFARVVEHLLVLAGGRGLARVCLRCP